jgi:hypothetical protein
MLTAELERAFNKEVDANRGKSEFLADCQQTGAVVRAGNYPVAAELVAEDFDRCFEEADADILCE